MVGTSIRASSAASLETRAPFLDHRVAELAWQLPLSLKLRNGVGKWALRQLLDRPNAVLRFRLAPGCAARCALGRKSCSIPP
jgi:asparagine synthetase B (glutamine-hydrolysing)